MNKITNLNEIVNLLDRNTPESRVSLYKTFKALRTTPLRDDLKEWVADRYREFLNSLLDGTQRSTMVYMRCMQFENVFPYEMFKRIMPYCAEYLKYDDVRYYYLKSKPSVEKLLELPDPSGENWVCKVPSSKKVFTDAWMNVLAREIDHVPVLNRMTKIIPHFYKPQQLMDFLTDSYNVGGITSLLALNSLFYLMQNYKLDYPNFFIKLYALLDQELMHVRYRSRFFRMLDVFLNSTHVSAALLASFLKRLARLCLTAPPAGIVTVIPLTYNLLKKHPSLMVLLHRTDLGGEFDETEKDPEKTGAINSSLWELASLTNHYHPNVATLARILSEQFTKPQYNMEDFLDHSYTTLTDAEFRKRLKKQVPVRCE